MNIYPDMAESEQCRRDFGNDIVSVCHTKRFEHALIVRPCKRLISHARTAEKVRLHVFMRKIVLNVHRAKYRKRRAERMSRHGDPTGAGRNKGVYLVAHAFVGA